MPDLAVNPVNRFSRIAAHMIGEMHENENTTLFFNGNDKL